MTNRFSLQDLLCVYPFSNFELISLGNLEEAFFLDVAEDVHQLKGGELLLLQLEGLREPVSETIRKAAAAQVSAIFIKGKSLVFNIPDITNGPPVLFYQHDFSLQDIEKTLKLIDQLKSIDQFQSFVKNSTYHIIDEVNEIGFEEYLARLEGKIGRKVIVTDPFFKELFRNEENLPKPLAVRLRNQYLEVKASLQFLGKASSQSQVKVSLQHQGKTSSQSQVKVSLQPQGKANSQSQVKVSLQPQGKASLRPGDFIPIRLETNSYWICPLANYGYLIIEGENLSTFVSYQIEAMIPVIKAELIKLNQLFQHEKKYQRNFIYDLLHNNFESQYIIINQARNWGWDLTVPQVLLVMKLKNGNDSYGDSEEADRIEKIIKNTLSALFCHPITVELDGLFIIMIPFEHVKPKKEMKLESRKIAESIHKKILEYKPGVQVSSGIGRFYPSIMDTCRSYQEAKIALQLGADSQGSSFVSHFEDLGLIRLLANVRLELLEEYRNEYLGELDEFDTENETDMVHTLQVYISENGNLKSTADQLFIHINTLRNRIKKIESILNIDFQNYEDLMNVYISLKIKNMNSRS